MKNRVLIALLTCGVLLWALTKTSGALAQTSLTWDTDLIRDPQAGLAQCLMAVHEVNPAAPGDVNIVVEKNGGGNVTVKGEYGKQVQVKLVCQPNSSYSSSLGVGVKVGSPTPALPGTTSPLGDHPEGMAWTMVIGNQSGQPFTATFVGTGVWGSNTLTLTTVPFAAPASIGYVNALDKRNSDALDKHAGDNSLHGAGRPAVFGLGIGYIHSLDSDDGRPRNGFGGLMEGYVPLYKSGSLTLSLPIGINLQYDTRYQPVRNVPNLQPVGAYADWSSLYIGPHVGLALLAPSDSPVAFIGAFRASLGLWHFVDGTVPLSQTSVTKDVQVGPAEDESSFAGKLTLSLGGNIFKYVSVMLDLSVTRSFTAVTLFRGPADTTTFQRPRGNITDFGIGPSVMAHF
jgi:hypothetical protein